MPEIMHPKWLIRNGNLWLELWPNNDRLKVELDGRYVIRIHRSGRDKLTGQPKTVEIYLLPSEIPDLLTMASKAYTQCIEKEDIVPT